MVVANARNSGMCYVLNILKDAPKATPSEVKALWKEWNPPTVYSADPIENVLLLKKPQIRDAEIMAILEELHG